MTVLFVKVMYQSIPKPPMPPPSSPWAFEFFEKFWWNCPVCWQFRWSNAHWLAFQKHLESPTHQKLFQNFPMDQFVYSNINIVIHIRNISKSQKAVLWRFVHLHKIIHSRKPTFTGFFKGSQSSNKTANIGAKTCKHRAHTEWSKNYKILSLATPTSILTRKESNDRLGRPHFESNSPLYGTKP